jgi:hypothetical protein
LRGWSARALETPSSRLKGLLPSARGARGQRAPAAKRPAHWLASERAGAGSGLHARHTAVPKSSSYSPGSRNRPPAGTGPAMLFRSQVCRKPTAFARRARPAPLFQKLAQSVPEALRGGVGSPRGGACRGAGLEFFRRSAGGKEGTGRWDGWKMQSI